MLHLLAKTNNFGSKIDNVAVWHRNALQDLTSRIQSKIFNLQHPQDCSNAKLVFSKKYGINKDKLLLNF